MIRICRSIAVCEFGSNRAAAELNLRLRHARDRSQQAERDVGRRAAFDHLQASITVPSETPPNQSREVLPDRGEPNCQIHVYLPVKGVFGIVLFVRHDSREAKG